MNARIGFFYFALACGCIEKHEVFGAAPNASGSAGGRGPSPVGGAGAMSDAGSQSGSGSGGVAGIEGSAGDAGEGGSGTYAGEGGEGGNATPPGGEGSGGLDRPQGGDGGEATPGGAGMAGMTTPPSVPTVQISAGRGHTCAVYAGELYCAGSNEEGELGIPGSPGTTHPVRVAPEIEWRVVEAAYWSTLALAEDGTLWGWGANNKGQLGMGDSSARQVPTRIGDRSDWVRMALNFGHACAIAGDGTLWCWGNNQEHQLGQGGVVTNFEVSPTQVGDAMDWVSVDTGDGHTCGIRSDRTLWCWGRNENSILGLGLPPPLARVPEPLQVGTATGWESVSTGQDITCGVREGTLYCWGAHESGALPFGEPDRNIEVPTAITLPDSPIVGVSVDTFGGCAWSADERSFCWGQNLEGQLGLEDNTNRLAPALVPGIGWTTLSVARFSTCGVRSGKPYCAGQNSYGQLGQRHVEDLSRFSEFPLP